MTVIRFSIRCIVVALACAAAPALAQQTQPDATPPPVTQPSDVPARPWEVGDPAPGVEGIHLGDSEAKVIAVLGQPAAAPPGVDYAAAPLHTLRYRGGALMIAISKADEVVKIMLRKPEGGSIAGIRVGDRLGRLVHLWGSPTVGAGPTGKWPMGDWIVSVRADMVTNVVMRIMLARAVPAPVVPPAVVPATPAQ